MSTLHRGLRRSHVVLSLGIALLSALGLIALFEDDAQAYHVPWADYAVPSTLSNPTAITAVDIDGLDPQDALEVVVIGEELPVKMTILSSNDDGTYTALPAFTIDEFGAATPRLDRLHALGTYEDASGPMIVIAGTPTGGSSPYFRLYGVSHVGVTPLVELEMTWLSAGTVGDPRSVAEIGDLDGNGVNDLAVGFPDDNRVEIVFLDIVGTWIVVDHQTIQQGVGNFVGKLIVDGEIVVETIEADDDLGWSLAKIHDYPAGAPDPDIANIAVGVPGWGADTGMVSLISLASDGTVANDLAWNGTALGTITAGKARIVEEPAEIGSRFGASVTWIPEFNHDYGDSISTSATGDLFVGIPYLDDTGLHENPDPEAPPRVDRGGMAMLDLLVFQAINTQNWLVMGDRSAGLCREFPDDAHLGRDAAVVGDVFGDGEADYLILGDVVTASHSGITELLLLNMDDAFLWHWDHSAADTWHPTVASVDAEQRYAVLGITNGDPRLPDVWPDPSIIEGFKVGSCWEDDPITIQSGSWAGCGDVQIEGNAIIEVGGILVVQGDLVVNGTLTNRGTIETFGCATAVIGGTGEIQLTGMGTLLFNYSLTWDLPLAENYGLITNKTPDQRVGLTFNSDLINRGTINLSNLAYSGSSSGISGRRIENYGEVTISSAASDFTFWSESPSDADKLFVNHPGATLDLYSNRTISAGVIDFYTMRPVNHGEMILSAGPDNHIQSHMGLENSGTITLMDDVRFTVSDWGLTPIVWDGGSLVATGVGTPIFERNAPAFVNVDWTIPSGIEMRSDYTSTMDIAGGATLSIEGLMRTIGGSYTYSQHIITGAGSFRIESGGELRIESAPAGIKVGLLQVSTSAFECAGTIHMLEPGEEQGTVILNPQTGLLIEAGGELIMDAPFAVIDGPPTTKRYLEGEFVNHGTIRVDMPEGSTTEWHWPVYFPPPGGTYDNREGGLLEIHSPVNAIWDGTDLLNAGTVAFYGDGEISLTGDFTQTATGVLQVELNDASPAGGSLRPSGQAQFLGDLSISTAADFAPATTSSVVLAGYGSTTLDVFANEFYPAGDLGFQLNYEPTQLLLNVHTFTLSTYNASAGVAVDLAPGSGQARVSMPAKRALPTAGSARLASTSTGDRLYALLDPGASASLTYIDPVTLTASTPVSLSGPGVSEARAITVGRKGRIIVAFDGTTTPTLLGRISHENLLAGTPTLSSVRKITFSPPTPGAQLDLLSTSPTGKLYAVDNAGGSNPRLWSIDMGTGDAIDIGDIIYLTGALDGMAFLGDELWVSSSSAGEALHIDPADGTVLDTVVLSTTGLSGLATRRVVDVDPEIRTRSAIAGGAILIDAPTHVPPPNLVRYDLYRASSLAELLYGTPSFIASNPTLDFGDATTADYTTYFYRVDLIIDDAAKAASPGKASGEVGALGSALGKTELLAARLYSGPALAAPRFWISELAPAGGVPKTGDASRGSLANKIGEKVEIQNLSPSQQDLTGYRLSNGSAEEALSGIVAGDGFFVHTLTVIDLNASGGTLLLLAPGNDYELDSVAWGTEGGAPAVPPGFTISRVDGSTPEDPDAESFDISAPTFGAANNVQAPALGSSIVINEVYFEGAAGADYVELINPTGSMIALDKIAISDGVSFVDTLEAGASMLPGQLTVLDTNSPDAFNWDLVQSTLYLYQITASGDLQRIDQLGWGSSLPDFAPPLPVAPNDAVVRTPDGIPYYLGDGSANWVESGGDLALFYGPQTPGAPNVSEATVVYAVDPLGGGDYLSIGDALLAATPGVKILIEPGTYAESLTLMDGVDLTGNGDTENPVVIVGDGLGPAIVGTGLGSQTRVSNLRIESSAGGMKLVSSSPVVSNVWFTENQSSGDGAALSIDGGAPVLTGCVFRNNLSGGNGGAVSVLSGSPYFAYCLFVHNEASSKGGAIHTGGGTTTVENCSFDRSGSGESLAGAIHCVAGQVDAQRCTITDTSAGAALRTGGAGLLFFSCGLLYGNADAIPGGDAGVILDNVLYEDPMFCQPLAMNYSYSESSPLVTLGTSCGAIIGVAGPPCGSTVTGTELPDRSVASGLLPAMPNPFNPQTTLRFELADAARVQLDLYDVRGRRIASPVAERRYEAGTHQVSWQGRDANGLIVASGVYFAVLRLDGQRVGDSQRLVLLK